MIHYNDNWNENKKNKSCRYEINRPTHGQKYTKYKKVYQYDQYMY